MNKTLEMAGNMYVYENPRCDCKITTNYTEDGVEVHGIQLKSIDGFHKYAYAPIDGLVMIDLKTGSIIEKNKVIEDFLDINLSEADQLKDYINTYGFFMPLPQDGKYRIFNHIELGCLLYRYKILVQLISAIEEKSIDYDKILKLTTYLLFAIPRQITYDGNIEGLCSCQHAFTNMWYKIDELPDLTENAVTSFSNDPYDEYYPIPDTFTNNEEKLGLIDYHENVDEVESYLSSSSTIFKAKMTKLYRDGYYDGISITARHTIDYYYHLLRIGIEIDDIDEKGKIKTNIKLNTYKKFDKHFKEKLIELAKLTIKEEFDFELYGIHPVYNTETMSPNWEIPNFLTAMYFALFYTRPDYEIYRQCANPNCNRLFKVKTTNSRKIYHDPSCQNAAAQRRHRKAIK